MFEDGGYVARFGNTRFEASRTLYQLNTSFWLDHYSSALVVEFVAYCVDANLVTFATFMFEFPSCGGVIRSWNIQTMRLYQSTSAFNVFLILFQLVYLAYTIYLCVLVFTSLRKLKCKKFFKDAGNVIDFLSCLFSVSAIIVYIVHLVKTNNVVRMYNNGKDTHAAIVDLYIWDTVLSLILGILIVLVSLKFLHLLRFNPFIYKFMCIFTLAYPQVIMMIIMLSIVFMVFSTMIYVAAGYLLYNFRSFRYTIFMVMDTLICKVKILQLEEVHPVFGPLMLLLCAMTIFILMLNLMAAILIDALIVISDNPQPQEETEILKLLALKVIHWFGIKKKAPVETDIEPTDTVPEEEADELQWPDENEDEIPLQEETAEYEQEQEV